MISKSEVESLILARSKFQKYSEVVKTKLPIKKNEEFPLVDYMSQISNLGFSEGYDQDIRFSEYVISKF
jgi:hypothetical protein